MRRKGDGRRLGGFERSRRDDLDMVRFNLSASAPITTQFVSVPRCMNALGAAYTAHGRPTHPLDHPPPLAVKHLSLLYPPLPRPKGCLQYAVPDHRDPHHRLALLKVHVVCPRARSESNDARAVAEGQVDSWMKEGWIERLVCQVLEGSARALL